jgi:hypothetical protein
MPALAQVAPLSKSQAASKYPPPPSPPEPHPVAHNPSPMIPAKHSVYIRNIDSPPCGKFSLCANPGAIGSSTNWRTSCLNLDCVHLCELSLSYGTQSWRHAALRTFHACVPNDRAGQVLSIGTHGYQRQGVGTRGNVKGCGPVLGPTGELARRPSGAQIRAARCGHDAEANLGNLRAGAGTIGNATAIQRVDVPTGFDGAAIDWDASSGCQCEKQSYNSSHRVPGRFITAKNKFRPRTRLQRSSLP